MQDRQIDPEVFGYVKKPLDITLSDIDKQGERSFDQIKAYIGVGFAVVIYMFIFIYGVQVMRGVMEEKQSRIVEVLISSVKPFQLMMGKIVGIALVGLTQFVLWVGLSGIMITAAAAVLSGDKYDPEAIATIRSNGALQPDLQQQGAALTLDDRDMDQFVSEMVASLPASWRCSFSISSAATCCTARFSPPWAPPWTTRRIHNSSCSGDPADDHRIDHLRAGRREPGRTCGVLVFAHPLHFTGGDDDPRGDRQCVRASLAARAEHAAAGRHVHVHHLAGRAHLPHRHPHVRQEGVVARAG
jgi:hypothetical protein